MIVYMVFIGSELQGNALQVFTTLTYPNHFPGLRYQVEVVFLDGSPRASESS